MDVSFTGNVVVMRVNSGEVFTGADQSSSGSLPLIYLLKMYQAVTLSGYLPGDSGFELEDNGE